MNEQTMTTSVDDELHDLRRQMVGILAAIMAEPSPTARKILRARLEDVTDRIRALQPGADPYPTEPVEIVST